MKFGCKSLLLNRQNNPNENVLQNMTLDIQVMIIYILYILIFVIRYRNPRTNSYVPTEILWPLVFGIPCSVFLIHFLVTKNKLEFIQANLAITLALGLNGIFTNVLKLCVGKEINDSLFFMEILIQIL